MRKLFLAVVLLVVHVAPAIAANPYAIVPLKLSRGDADYAGVVLFQPDTGRTWLLDTSEGKPPACVITCPTQALSYGGYEAFTQEAKRRAALAMVRATVS